VNLVAKEPPWYHPALLEERHARDLGKAGRFLFNIDQLQDISDTSSEDKGVGKMSYLVWKSTGKANCWPKAGQIRSNLWKSLYSPYHKAICLEVDDLLESKSNHVI
jgi:hypothetical protein